MRSYLEKWFSILGSTFPGKNLWYVDGFAGPGEYGGGNEGSPVAAIKAADKALTLVGRRWKARAVRCVFIEEDAARFSNLQRCLDRCSMDSRIAIAPRNSSFVEGIEALQRADDGPFRFGEPIFAFIDPFGAKGMPFAVVRDLLMRKTVEVLINLDSDGINRIYEAGEWADHDRVLTEVFGDRSWESLRSVQRSQERVQAILSLYKSKLLAIPSVRYVFLPGERTTQIDLAPTMHSRQQLVTVTMIVQASPGQSTSLNAALCFQSGAARWLSATSAAVRDRAIA